MSEAHPKEPGGQTQENAPPTSKRSRPLATLRRFAVGAWRGVNSQANGIIAVFTVVMTVATVLMWKSTERSLELTRQSIDLAARLERAEVVVEEVSKLSLSSSERYEGVIVRIRNVGRVPAQAVEIMSRPTRPVDLGERTELPCDRWANAGMVASALAPGQETTHATAPIKLTHEGSRRIYHGQVNMYLWVKIRYADAFGDAERNSCYAITGTGLAPRLPPTTPWRRCAGQDFKPNARTRCDQGADAK